MKKYSIIVVVVFAIVFILNTACQKDIILEPLPTLSGAYEGAYLVITEYRTPDSEVTESRIEMSFGDQDYHFNSLDDPDAFCDPYGDYLLSANNIEFDETNKNCGQTIATESDNPRGKFSIRRPPPDSVIMLQIDTTKPPTFKGFFLKKK